MLRNSSFCGEPKSGAAAEAVLIKGVERNKTAKAMVNTFFELFNI